MTFINTAATQRKPNKAIYLALNTCQLIINQPITADRRNIGEKPQGTVSPALQRISAELHPYQTDIRLIWAVLLSQKQPRHWPILHPAGDTHDHSRCSPRLTRFCDSRSTKHAICLCPCA